MHILIIPSWYTNTFLPLSGIFFKEQAEALAKGDNKIALIATQEISILDMIKNKKILIFNKIATINNVRVYNCEFPSIPKFPNLKKKIRFCIFKKQFKKYIKENGLPDIIHLHSFMSGEYAIWIKEIYKIPYLITEHSSSFKRNLLSDEELLYAKKVFENSSYNLSVSTEFSKLLENKFNLKFEYIGNIVNTEFFNIKNLKNSDPYTFINIAFLDKNKNQDMLIKAFIKAFINMPKVKLTIVGNGLEYNNLKLLINKENMNKQISLYGKANRNEVKTLLQESDAFVLSSEYETFGVVIIEAMACGLPVVSTKCGGAESIINSEKLGVLAEINIDSLASELLYLYNNKESFDKNYIREYIEYNFSEKAIVNKLNTLYKSILKK